MNPTGVVSARRGSRLEVFDDTGAVRSCRLRRRFAQVVVGDRVTLRPLEGGGGVIEALEKRRSVLARPASAGGMRIVAANVDFVLVVIALAPPASRRITDRHLVGTEHLGVPAGLVLNKIDLGREDARGPDLDPYRRIGYPVFETSALTSAGTEVLADALADRTSILVGPSGAGKSSLVRSLVPDADPAVGALSRRGGHGRHTTTVSTLHPLPGGGFVIDSPGVVDFGEWPLPEERIVDGFPEIRAYSGQCRFRNCRHLREPDCAVAAAPDVDPQRLESYRTMVESARG